MEEENIVSDEIFKKMWLRGDEDIRKYLERLIEYGIGHPIGEYTVKEFENEIILITEEVVYLVKYHSKPHTVDEDSIFLTDFSKKVSAHISESARLVHIAINGFYNPYDEEITKTMIEIER